MSIYCGVLDHTFYFHLFLQSSFRHVFFIFLCRLWFSDRPSFRIPLVFNRWSFSDSGFLVTRTSSTVFFLELFFLTLLTSLISSFFHFRFHFRQMNLNTMRHLRWSFLSYMHAFLAVPSAHPLSFSSVFVLELIGPQHQCISRCILSVDVSISLYFS